ncbi:E3 ubiquitin-protein ligase TRIM21 [Trichoplax sp. H2]|nr:E3 ubiquitin-protein ligase TRIM21 [Trichoplax sp. H2]|eukprot:RDD43059.1 E3 ubiquitin-protein ligase TRIM21 [Trichoplax sp. H2]
MASNICSDDICSICLCPFDDPVMIDTCYHCFCSSCIKTAVQNQSNTCPLCRGPCDISRLRPIEITKVGFNL